MSNRERWIIYPLLVLSLGASLRDKITQTISQIHFIHGRELDIDLLNGIVQGKQLTANRLRGQQVECQNFRGGVAVINVARCQRLIVDELVQCGSLAVVDSRGQATATLRAEPPGGRLALRDSEGQLTIALGHYAKDRASGLVAQPHAGPISPLAPLIKRPEKVDPEEEPAVPAAAEASE